MDKSETYKAIASRLGMAARPGAKAVMSKATDALDYIKSSIASGKTVYVQAGSRTTKITPQTYAKWEAAGRPLFKISNDGALLMASGSSYVRLTMGEEMLVRVTAMSRPGAKAVMSIQVGDRVNVMSGSHIDAYGFVVAITSGKATIATAQGNVRAKLEDLKLVKRGTPSTLESAGFARSGAKSRHSIREGDKVSASDDAVSRKIRKLMDEGKPQKQAIAIALDLERRGEL
jgi:preprotein translocase subunit YajC